MATTTFTAENPTEALLLEQALAFARQLTRVANDAPDGQVLALAERCALYQGRELLRHSMEIVLQAQAESVEKKGLHSERVHANRDATTKANRPSKL